MAVAQRATQNHYEILGVTSSASFEEIRRAYRILARRYHPDVNPGKSSEERFKRIADAYRTLSDEAKRREFDQELEGNTRSHFDRGRKAYEQAIRRAATEDRARRRFEHAQAQARAERAQMNQSAKTTQRSTIPTPDGNDSFFTSLRRVRSTGARILRGLSQEIFPSKNRPEPRSRTQATEVRRVSVIEVSVPLRDAILGARKSIEIPEPHGARKVSIRIPPGVRHGSVLRTRAKGSDEELVVLVRVATHPFLRIEPRGLVCEVPLTVQEALIGANITVPTLDDPIVLKVPAGSQSGLELRVKERGITHTDGTRGDLFYRLIVRVPESVDAVGLKEKAAELERYYGGNVRQGLPKHLLQNE